MNILFIWIGLKTPLYEWRTKCIRRAKEIYPEAEFKVVTYIKCFFGFETIEPPDISISLNDTMLYSDHLRMQWLAEYPHTLYLDTDTWCKEAMPITDKMGNAHFEAIWNGTECDKIKEVYELRTHDSLLCGLSSKLSMRGNNLNEYFEHKPLWSKKYSRPDLSIFNPD